MTGSKLGLRVRELLGRSSRHLKTRALDLVEYVLVLVTGALLGALVVSVAADVASRLLGHPILWIQEATLIVFVWMIFIGAAAAVRRGEHFSLIGGNRGGEKKQRVLELINGSVSLVVGAIVIVFGFRYFDQQFHNALPVTGLPLAVMAGALPVFGVFLAVFTAERLMLGLKRGFVRDVDDEADDAPEGNDEVAA